MSKRKSTLLLEHNLKKLKLSTILREFKTVAAISSGKNFSYEKFLLELAEREIAERVSRAKERRIKAAKFPNFKTLESFDFAASPWINEQLVRELMTGEFIDQRENILLIGNSGTGKTHLATAIATAACTAGKRVRFFSVTSLVTQLLESREDRKLQKLFGSIGKFDLIVLDELGYVPFSKAGAELLFEVVSKAYESQSLIVTTNLPFENWIEVCGSERLTGAMLDRLTHRVNIIESNGESYRLRDSQKRLKKRKSNRRK